MKTNREKNKEHEAKELMRVRPKQPNWDFTALEQVVNAWIRQGRS